MKIIKVLHDCDLIDGHPCINEKVRSFDFREFAKSLREDIISTAEIQINKKKDQTKAEFNRNNDLELFKGLIPIPIIGRKVEKLASDKITNVALDFDINKHRDQFIIDSAMFHAFKAIESLSNDVEFLSLSDAKQRYSQTPNLTVGSYTLHPRSSSILTRLANFHKNLAMDKDDELVMLLGRMGAKTVEIMNLSEQRQAFNIEAEASVCRTVNGSAGVSLASATEKNQHLIVQFEGRKTDIADDLLTSSVWFADDSKLNAIFESRRFSENQILDYTLTNTYSDSFDFDFDLAAKYLGAKGELKAEYQSISKQVRMFKVSFSEM